MIPGYRRKFRRFSHWDLFNGQNVGFLLEILYIMYMHIYIYIIVYKYIVVVFFGGCLCLTRAQTDTQRYNIYNIYIYIYMYIYTWHIWNHAPKPLQLDTICSEQGFNPEISHSHGPQNGSSSLCSMTRSNFSVPWRMAWFQHHLG